MAPSSGDEGKTDASKSSGGLGGDSDREQELEDELDELLKD